MVILCFVHQTVPVDIKPWKDGFQPQDGMIANKAGTRVPLPGKLTHISQQYIYLPFPSKL